mmetsp:Transcript_59900/g.140112  ORF Transcript_59900/g.140112 Transcript_59900/m.140112 type:complete len:239 (-) Transcript_59900:212-928(-)
MRGHSERCPRQRIDMEITNRQLDLNLWMEFCEPTLGNCPVVVVLVLAVCSEDPDTLHPGQSQAVLGQEVAEHGILLEAPTEGYVDHQHAISIGLKGPEPARLAEVLQGCQVGSSKSLSLRRDAGHLQELDDANHCPCALQILQLHKMTRLYVLRQLEMQECSIWQLGFQNLTGLRSRRHHKCEVHRLPCESPVAIWPLCRHCLLASLEALGHLHRYLLALWQPEREKAARLTCGGQLE